MQHFHKEFSLYFDFFSQHFFNNPSFLDTYIFYKTGGSFRMSRFLVSQSNDNLHFQVPEIRQVLNQFYKTDHKAQAVFQQLSSSSSADIKKLSKDILPIKKLLFSTYVSPMKKHIFNIDSMIQLSPGLSSKTTVFRGMRYDIFHDIYSVGNKYFFQSSNFFATSFDPNHSAQYSDEYCCFYSILLPPKTQGIFMFNLLQDKNKSDVFQVPVDPQHEFVLPRNSTFQVLKQSQIQNLFPDYYFTFGEQKILKKFPFYVKHYFLKFISSTPLDIPNLNKFNKNIPYVFANRFSL